MVRGKTVWMIAIGSLGLTAVAACGSTQTATATPVSTPAVKTSPTPKPVDVAAATEAAIGLFVADPSHKGVWYACSAADDWAACPLSATVKARLAYLVGSFYFADNGGCGEDYISGTQNGLDNDPKVTSAVAGTNGSVTVVIQRAPSRPNLTAVMNTEGGKWLAYDLASGTGAAASIFSAKPNC